MAVALAAAIVAAAAAPLLVHAIPVEGLGPRLVPLFYAPLLAALLLDLRLAVAVSVAAPLINSLATGMPPSPLVPALAVQLGVFVVLVRLMQRYRWVVVAPAAYVVSLGVTVALSTPLDWPSIGLLAGLRTALPGMVVMAGIGLLLERSLR